MTWLRGIPYSSERVDTAKSTTKTSDLLNRIFIRETFLDKVLIIYLVLKVLNCGETLGSMFFCKF